MGWRSGQSYSQDLRDRVLGAVDGGAAVRQVAATFGVSVACIEKALIRRRLMGDAGINPNRGHHPRKLRPEQELALAARDHAGGGAGLAFRGPRGATGHDGNLEVGTPAWPFVQKTLCAAEEDRPDVAARRRLWKPAQPFIDPESLVFPDETGVNTKMARLYGWAPVGERSRDAVPFGNWKTVTFIAGLRLSGLTAPWMLDGPMDGDAFRVHVHEVLGPTPKRGDVVVLDKLPAHRVAGIREAVTARRDQLFCLPPCRADLNPIEMAFAKRKALLRQDPARTIDRLAERIATLLDRFHPSECANFFQAAGYQRSM